MKKLLFFLGAVMVLASCTNIKETDEYKALLSQNDSLMSISGNQSTDIYKYLSDFNSIQANLNEIKKKEKIISVNKAEYSNADKKEAIVADINSIYELMKENQKKIGRLNRKLKKSDSKNRDLQKLIENLNKQIEENRIEIEALNQELDRLNIQIKDLTTELASVKEDNEEKDATISQQTNKLQQAFYAVGTSKELLEHKIITKEGGIAGIGKNTKLDDNFDKTYFTEINSSSFNQVELLAKKAKLVTSHPKESYEFVNNGDKVEALKITNAEAFWSVSKYLVIEISK